MWVCGQYVLLHRSSGEYSKAVNLALQCADGDLTVNDGPTESLNTGETADKLKA